MERWGKIGVRRPQVYQLNSLTSYRRKKYGCFNLPFLRNTSPKKRFIAHKDEVKNERNIPP